MENAEKSYELRSEKVRSIVGQIPPALTRYGISIIAVVLVILFSIAYFMPYKQVYSGTITFYNTTPPNTTAYITFTNNKALNHFNEEMTLILHSGEEDIKLKIQNFTFERDTLNRYPAVISSKLDELVTNKLKNHTFDFTIVEDTNSLLLHFLPKNMLDN